MQLEFIAQVAKVSVSAKEVDGNVRRICRLTLQKEFDWVIAESLGADAKTALNALSSHGLSEVTIPMDALVVSGTLKTIEADEVEIPMMRGVKAKARAGKEVDDLPTVRLEWEMEMDPKIWVFLGLHVSAYATITVTKLQTEFAFRTTPSVGEKAEA